MEGLNFVDAFEQSVKKNWESIAVEDIERNTIIRYKDLAKDILYLHRFWDNIGISRNNRIAICASNCYAWIQIYIAVVTSGRVAVILPSNLSESEVLSYLSHSSSSVFYCERNIFDRIPNLNNSTNVRLCIEITTKDVLMGDSALLRRYSGANNCQINECLSPQSVSFSKFSCDEIHLVLYTSGSSGHPKGVMQSRAFSMMNVEKINNRFCPKNGEPIICINPFFHVFSQGTDIGPALCSGMRLVIVHDLSPQKLISTFVQYRPKRICASPFILMQILQYIFDDRNIELTNNNIIDFFGGKLDAFITGGAAMPKEIETMLYSKYNFPLQYVYGSTECGILSLGSSIERYGSSGKVVHSGSVRIEPLSFGYNIGEIQVKNRFIFSGYYNSIEATKDAFTSDGWFKTGDLGYIDEDGYLFITGRCKDMLLTSNGENIYPEEVEAIVNASPYVKESILVQRGEKLYAIVVPDREKAEADGLDAEGLNKKIDETVREASKKLPGFTIISGFELRDEPLERTPKGSLKRYLYSDGIKEN